MGLIEVEVKFYLNDIHTIRNRILGLGAENQGKFFETNIRFENKHKSLIQKKSLLRLRNGKNIALAFKTALPDKESQFKIHTEWEVEISDFDTMACILESLGFHREQIYEKWRETFLFNDTQLCLDTMPYGDFLEIEGGKQNIKDVAGLLGLQWQKRIVMNYLSLFDIIKQNSELPFNDITFKNFADIQIDFPKYCYLLEAGED